MTLIQTNKIHHFPVFLMGEAYWGGLIDWIREVMLRREGFISPEDLNLWTVTDDPQTVVDHVLAITREQVETAGRPGGPTPEGKVMP